MNAYIYQAALWCEDCIDGLQAGADTGDSDDYPQGPYSDGGGEADWPQHCDGCGVFLENPLTSDGSAYVLNRVIEHLASNGEDGNPIVIQEWAAFYDVPTDLDPPYYFDRVDLAQGVYWACTNYHEGQWSRGYRLLCQLGRIYKPGAIERGPQTWAARGAYVRTAVRLLRDRCEMED